MKRKTIFSLSAAAATFLIAIAAINMAIKKYEKEPTAPAVPPPAQESRQTESAPPESVAPDEPDVESEPPIPSNQTLSY